MDPLYHECIINGKLSFDKKTNLNWNEILPVMYSFDDNDNQNVIVSMKEGNKIILNDTISPIKNVEENASLKELYGKTMEDKRKDEVRIAIDPFEKAEKGPYQINRCSLKLANIDAVYELTTYKKGSYPNYTKDESFTHVGIADGPGGFTSYILSRVIGSSSSGITLKTGNNLDWHTTMLANPLFKHTEGDILKEYKTFSEVNKNVDLVTADGGIEVKDLSNEEFVYSHLLAVEAYMGIICCKERTGKFVLKFFDTNGKFMRDLIYILLRCFQRGTLFKPITSRGLSSEVYGIFEAKRSESEIIQWTGTLLSVIENYEQNKKIVSIIDNETKSFDLWLYENNKSRLIRQKLYLQAAISYVNGDELPKELAYKANLNKFFTLLAVDDHCQQEKKGEKEIKKTSIKATTTKTGSKTIRAVAGSSKKSGK